jgi:hypothetical protein
MDTGKRSLFDYEWGWEEERMCGRHRNFEGNAKPLYNNIL